MNIIAKKILNITILSFLLMTSFDVVAQSLKTKSDSISYISRVEGLNLKFYNNFLDSKKSNPIQAANYAKLIINNIDSTENNILIADIYDFLSDYYYNNEFIFTKSLFYQNKTMDILKYVKDVKKEAVAEYKLARIYIKLGKIDKALLFALSSLNKSKEHSLYTNERNCYYVLGNIYYYSDDFEKAQYYYNKLNKDYNSIEELRQMIIAMNNIAVINVIQRNYENAKSLSLECLQLCNKNNLNELAFEVYHNLVSLYNTVNDTINAKRYLDTLEVYANNIYKKGLYNGVLGVFYQNNGEHIKAIESFKSAIAYYKHGEFDNEIKNTYLILYYQYKSLSLFKEALNAIEEYYKIDNKLPKSKILLELYQTQNKYNIQSERERSGAISNKQQLIILLSIILLLVVTTIYLYLNTKKERQLKKSEVALQIEKNNHDRIIEENINKQKLIEYELKSKNEILKIKKINQYQEQLLMKKIVTMLSDLNNKIKSKETNKLILDVIKKLNDLVQNGEWHDIEKSLVGLNTSFYENLTKAFPNLTINERRICTFLHMNLTSKEISAITNQSVNSIVAARFRLRKKFDITGSEESIITFLQQFD